MLKVGSKGHEVVEWQTFLASVHVFSDSFDGIYGPKTAKATKAFQSRCRLPADGIAGPNTFAKAASVGWTGFHHAKNQKVVEAAVQSGDVPGYMDPSWPSPLDENHDGKADLVYQGGSWREENLGHIEYVPAPTTNNKEAIRITNDFADNVVKVKVPQLVGVAYAPKSGEIYFHKKAIPQLLSMFNEWDKQGVLHYVKTWAGSYVPRFIRGSTRTLSNHAYGSAFDINVPWNGLGRTPALVGQEGTVRPLVTIAEQHGFYWGGRYSSRKDGMHFEIVKLI